MIYRRSQGKYKDYLISYSKEFDGRWIAESKEYNILVYADSKPEATFKLVEAIEQVKEWGKEKD